ncbi:MAG: dihydropteroate synthase [Chloroflexi bacterium 13_1_40CM_4_68_4]|nr:MAG: dihydropteroate synthase [Chloroflexi bacterium 13_1_40CM_4_68_4]
MSASRRPGPCATGSPEVATSTAFDWGARTYIFGVLNVTPDSFSGDGTIDASTALAHALAMRAEGADVIDVGGESTRPGHTPISAAEELRRIEPVVAALIERGLLVSIDTRKASVAQRAIELGARIVNDVSGMADRDMAAVVSRSRAWIVLMDDRDVRDAEDPVGLVRKNLAALVDRADRAGIDRERLILDPGFGFGKGPRENLAVLREIGRLRELRLPLLIGTSRKSTVGKVLGDLPPEERVEGTAATVAIAIAYGADAVRVHEVREMARVARMADAIVRG